jgi:beta-glucosidase
MNTLPENLSPKHFEWGCATSSFQIEGGGFEAGRVNSIWDDFCDQPGRIKDGSNGLVACDHFHRYVDDVKLIADLGFKHYRFSIAWTRIVNADNSVNMTGIDFYSRLLDELEKHSITPNATLFHWDLPSHLKDGWLNRDTAYRFADYTALIADHLGDRLPRVATLNEPWCSAFLGYDLGVFAPGHTNRESSLSAAHHLMLAHGLGIQAWRSCLPQTSLGIVLNPELCDPLTPKPEDIQAAKMAEYERNDSFLNSLFGREWPSALLDQMGSRLLDRHTGDLAITAQPLDFIGLNYYTRSIAKASSSPEDAKRGYTFVPPDPADTTKQLSDIGWEIYPKGLKRVINNLTDNWPLPPIWITENGAADNTPVVNGHCDDDMRCAYIEQHLHKMSELITEGTDIRGYYVWSLLDNFEWAQGYSQRFGIVHVDFETQVRTHKKSALQLKALLTNRL